ncbi:hypothetical protein [Fredinandcohnia onubensis]|uniref:hypothetical protein n=1 Tax=Fredinandcohnia onubensis TaxID=1571209 RepID=UPI000C0BCC8B|nr:hypothetical protein [Fredinandcohnia onubensis]
MLYILFAFMAIWFLTAFFSYYLFYFLTISVCSIGILTIFFWKIVWEGLYNQYRLRKDPAYRKNMAFYKEKKRNEKAKRLRKLTPFQKWKTTTNEILFSVFSWILIPCIFLGIPACALAIGGSFLLDFPSYLFGKTETATGYVSYYEEVSGRKSLSHTTVEIENEDYVLTHPETFYIGDKVKINYLPHTKIIRDFEIVEERKIQSELSVPTTDPSIKDHPAIGSWENTDDDEYISVLLSETGSATLGEIEGDEGIFYNGRWKYDEKEMIITIEVDGAENLSWQPVDHPVKIDIKVLSIMDDSLEIEYHQKKVRLIRLW